MLWRAGGPERRAGLRARLWWFADSSWRFITGTFTSKPWIAFYVLMAAVLIYVVVRSHPRGVQKHGVDYVPVTPVPTPSQDESHRRRGTSTVSTQFASVLSTPSGLPTLSHHCPRILLWTEPGQRRSVEGLHLPATGETTLRYCSFPVRDAKPEVPVETFPPDCYVTRDRSLFNLSDAVVFDASAVHGTIPPTFRASNQVWVFWTHVGSAPTEDLGSMTTDAFNWTMGRRMDADVAIPYGNWIRSEKAASLDFAKGMQTKNGTALFFSSDCDNKEGMKVLTEVMDALKGSTVRGCGASDCGWLQMCLSEYAEHFHFLFVAESSGCYEHPLEAIYDAFRYDLVPVYFGHKSLASLPPHSFVDAFAMLPAQDIVEYLNALVENPDLYSSFFEWKEEHVLGSRDDLCYLCDALKENRERQTTDVVAWWKKSNLCPLSHRINQAHSHPREAYLP